MSNQVLNTGYAIAGAVLSTGNDGDQRWIARAYQLKLRPCCLCRTPQPPMYISQFEGHYSIKRMPGTGLWHDSNCIHYDPAHFFVPGFILNDRLDPGAHEKIVLKLAFSLSRDRHRGATDRIECAIATAERRKGQQRLAQLSLLQLLWQRAGLNRWHPAFAHKRHWWTVRHRLRETASSMIVKGQPLLDRLFIPEMFHPHRKRAIEERRQAFLAPFHPQPQGTQQLILLIGEVKTIQQGRGTTRILLKHAPQFPIFVDEESLRTLHRKSAPALAVHQADLNSHLIMMATASVSKTNVALIEECTLMSVTEHWLPCDCEAESKLLASLTRHQRKFIKIPCFDHRRPEVPKILLTDTRPATAMFICPHHAGDGLEPAIVDIASSRGYAFWLWCPATGSCPEIPRPFAE